MDFLKRTFKELYLKFTDNNDKRTPLIANQAHIITYPDTQPFTPISDMTEPIPDIEEHNTQEQAKALRQILGPTVPELTILQLIQNYNSIEAALNSYLDNTHNY